MDELSQEKATLRRRIRAGRGARTAEEQAALGEKFAEILLPRLAGVSAVTSYLALPGEPDLTLVMQRLSSAGVVIWLPVVTTVDGQRALTWGRQDAGMVTGAATPTGLRLQEPAPPHVRDPGAEAVLLPGLAVDRRGVRLGQGAGYYDRTAETLGWPGGRSLIAIVHDDEVLDQVPAETHDLRATAICTPTRWIDCG